MSQQQQPSFYTETCRCGKVFYGLRKKDAQDGLYRHRLEGCVQTTKT